MKLTTMLRTTVYIATFYFPLCPIQVQAQNPAEAAAQDTDEGFATSRDDGSVIEDIVVTAQRRSENLQKVPIAITAVSSARLAATGITSAGDISAVTPGLSLPQASGTLQPHIRGVGTSSNGPGVENPVAIYVDGIYIASGTSSLLTLNNIDRIEVLKGPQGTLFGRNATGGLIHIITKEPTQDPSMSLNMGYGNFQTVTAGAYLSGGLTENVAADLAVRYEHQSKGWGTNLFNGKEVNRLDRDFAARGKIVIDAGDNTRIRLAGDYSNRVGSLDAQHWYAGYPITFNNAAFGGPWPQGGAFDVNKNIEETSHLRSGGVSLQINHDFGAVALQSTSAYRRGEFAWNLDLDLTPAQIISCCGVATSKQLSQEFQLSSMGSGPFKWVAGVYLFYAKDGYDPLDIVLDNAVSPVPFTPFVIHDLNATRTRSVAAYGQASYAFSQGTTLTLGGRFTYEDKNLTGTETIFIDGVNVGVSTLPLPGIPAKINFKRFNYRITLDHQFTPDILGYISYNTGFKSGGYNLSSSANPPYQPEDIKAAEVGFKMQLFDRHLRFNIASFYYKYKNIQVAQFTGGTQLIGNGAAAEIYGADFDVDLALGGGLSLNGGLSYVHDRFTSYPLAPYYSGFGGCTLPLGSFCNLPAKGNRLGQSPKWSYNVGGNYKTSFGAGSLELNILYSYMSRWYASADNFAFQPGYGLLNSSIKWSDASDHLSLRLWGKNLTNKTYSTGIFEANHGVLRSVGSPRTYGITLGYQF